MAITTATVTGPLLDATGAAIASEYVTFRPKTAGADNDVSPTTVIGRKTVEVQTDANGDLSVVLWVNGDSDINCVYEITTQNNRIEPTDVIIPTSAAGGSIALGELLINHVVSGSSTQQSSVLADAKAYTDALAADPSSNASLSASEWRTDLGLVIGTDVQAYDAQLADIAGLTPTDGNIIVGDGANFVAESGATARTSLGLGAADAVSHGSLTLTTDLAVAEGGTGASTASAARTNLGAQAQGDVLDDLNTLGAATADGEFIVATGSGSFAYESGTTVRASLGLQTNAAGSTTSVTTTTYTALSTDSVLLCNNASGVTVTLLAAATAGDGFKLIIKNLHATASVTVDGNGSETIDGGTTATLATQYESITIVSDGSNWHII